MRKNLLIVLFLASVLVISIFILFGHVLPQNIRKNALASLEKELKFCEIVRDEVNVLSSTGNFWMICNNRPFYAEYKNGSVSYELNGWSWLKYTEYWDELKDCDIYNIKNNIASFFCPAELSNDVVLKYFDLSEPFSLRKVNEENFFGKLINDLKAVRPFISDCSLSSYETQAGKVPRPIIIMNFSCDDGMYTIATSLSYVTPAIHTDRTTQEMIVKSFQKTFGVLPEIKELTASYDFSDWSIEVNYPASGDVRIVYVSILIKNKNSLPEIVTKFVPFFEGSLKFLKQERVTTQVDEPPIFTYDVEYYAFNNHILKIYFMEGKIIIMERMRGGFYE